MDLNRPHVPAVQPHPYLFKFWLNNVMPTHLNMPEINICAALLLVLASGFLKSYIQFIQIEQKKAEL